MRRGSHREPVRGGGGRIRQVSKTPPGGIKKVVVTRKQVVQAIAGIAEKLPLDRLEKLWRLALNVRAEESPVRDSQRTAIARARQQEVEILESSGLPAEAARAAREP
jgi:hypothetical protein